MVKVLAMSTCPCDKPRALNVCRGSTPFLDEQTEFCERMLEPARRSALVSCPRFRYHRLAASYGAPVAHEVGSAQKTQASMVLFAHQIRCFGGLLSQVCRRRDRRHRVSSF
jgi:hypothetical protein